MLYDDTEFSYYTQAEQQAHKALEHYESGRMTQALSALDSALELNPANGCWHFNKGLTLDSVNRFEEAISEYELALQSYPNDLEILNALAVDYTRTGRYDRAIELFEYIEQLDPQFEPCYCNRIITYTEMELHDQAEQMFYLAQQIDPDCPLCYYNIGNSLFIRGRYEEAVRCWLKTAELEPTHPQINYRIAQAYWSQGRMSLARRHFLAELRNNPGDVDVIMDFGLLLLESGEVESAKEKFNRVLEFEPDFAPALFYLGEIARDRAHREEATELFHKALEYDDTLAGARYRLAEFAMAAGEKAAARKHLLAELRFVRENADVLVSMGSMFLQLGEPRYATRCLLKAVELDGAKAEAYYYLAVASAMNERFDDAAEFFGHALDIAPRYVDALRDSAVVALRLGRVAQARQRIDAAISLDSNNPQLRAIRRRITLARLVERLTGLFALTP